MVKKITAPHMDLLVEVSWEVCNKIGGIYTVLSTRAKCLQRSYPDKVVFIGPDFENHSSSNLFKNDDSLLQTLGLSTSSLCPLIRVGRWNIPGEPIAILIRFESFEKDKFVVFAKLWERFGVDSLHAYGDYDEAALFSIAAHTLIAELYSGGNYSSQHAVCAHFNEWTTGVGALLTRLNIPQIATLFTTHATSIGRSIAGNNKPLYDYLDSYEGDQMAEELNMQSKHSLEKQTANNVDCFTTVSNITNLECAQLLDKPADVVTPNGFEFDFVPTKAKSSVIRKKTRSHIASIYNALTGKTLPAETIMISTSGRYEFKNKGIDLFIDALARIKRDNNTEQHILGLVLVPAWVKEPRKDLLARIQKINKVFATPLRKPYTTHDFFNEQSDSMLNQLNYLCLDNRAKDSVEVIVVPIYLSGDDPIVPFTYYEMLQATDLTVFPSYYEPWGYTPLESIAFGIPTITTTLSGFGVWAAGEINTQCLNEGVRVIERNDHNSAEVSEQIQKTIMQYASLSPEKVKEVEAAAKKLSKQADWKLFIGKYYECYQIAINNCNNRNN